MPTLRTTYVQCSFKDTPEYEEVCAISDKLIELLEHVDEPEGQ